jgi:hypothetical protein
MFTRHHSLPLNAGQDCPGRRCRSTAMECRFPSAGIESTPWNLDRIRIGKPETVVPTSLARRRGFRAPHPPVLMEGGLMLSFRTLGLQTEEHVRMPVLSAHDVDPGCWSPKLTH